MYLLKVKIRIAFFCIFSIRLPWYPHPIIQYLIRDKINVLYKRILISKGNTYFSLFKMPTILEHLFDIFQCFFKFKYVSKISPKSVILPLVLCLYLMVLNKVVLSAYIIKLNILLAFGKSLIYIINNKGPRIGLCGTPIVIGKISEL